MSKKDKMWVSCCGCGKPVKLPETTKHIETTALSIIWKSICPHCGFTHKITLTRWSG